MYAIHFVHSDNQLMNSERFYNVGVLFGLPAAAEGTLEVVSVYDQDCVVCLGCSCYHVRDEINVTWGI